MAEPLNRAGLRRLIPRGRLRLAAPLAAAALAVLAMLSACGGEAAAPVPAAGAGAGNVAVATELELSAGAEAGRAVFSANCALCHGEDAAGTGLGPPLVHRIYEPGHHPDASIRLAALSGVQQHHWTFGDMPAVAGVSNDEIEQVICYVRELQRADGIFDGDAFSTVC